MTHDIEQETQSQFQTTQVFEYVLVQNKFNWLVSTKDKLKQIEMQMHMRVKNTKKSTYRSNRQSVELSLEFSSTKFHL